MENSYSVNGIKFTFGKITVDSVERNEYKKGQYQAQIRQEITKTYPGSKIGNSNSDLLFEEDVEDMGEGQSYSRVRVTWLPLSQKRTVKDIEAQLKKIPNACIYAILSDNVEDVLTEEQLAAIDNDRYDVTLEDYEEKFLIKGKDGEELDTVEYQQFFFSKTFKKDIDLRKRSKVSSKSSAEIDAEEVF